MVNAIARLDFTGFSTNVKPVDKAKLIMELFANVVLELLEMSMENASNLTLYPTATKTKDMNHP